MSKKGSDNFISLADRPPEERKAIQSKGGKASVESRREKKYFKEALAKRLGYKDFDAIVDNLIERAKDNDKSFETLRDTMGQSPDKNVVLSTADEIKINIK